MAGSLHECHPVVCAGGTHPLCERPVVRLSQTLAWASSPWLSAGVCGTDVACRVLRNCPPLPATEQKLCLGKPGAGRALSLEWLGNPTLPSPVISWVCGERGIGQSSVKAFYFK